MLGAPNAQVKQNGCRRAGGLSSGQQKAGH